MDTYIEREVKLILTATQHRRLHTLLTQQYGVGQCLDQQNRFFEILHTDDGHNAHADTNHAQSSPLSLRDAGCSLRLRQQNQDCVLTVKQRQQTDTPISVAVDADAVGTVNTNSGTDNRFAGALHQHLEYEKRVHPALWHAVVQNHIPIEQVVGLFPCIYDALAHTTPALPLHCIGGFSNMRYLWHIPSMPDAEICLDRTCFADGHVDYELEIESVEAEKAAAIVYALLEQWDIAIVPQTTSKMARFLSHK